MGRSGGDALRQVDDRKAEVRQNGSPDPGEDALGSGGRGATKDDEAAVVGDLGRCLADGTEGIRVDGPLDQVERTGAVLHGEYLNGSQGKRSGALSTMVAG